MNLTSAKQHHGFNGLVWLLTWPSLNTVKEKFTENTKMQTYFLKVVWQKNTTLVFTRPSEAYLICNHQLNRWRMSGVGSCAAGALPYALCRQLGIWNNGMFWITHATIAKTHSLCTKIRHYKQEANALSISFLLALCQLKVDTMTLLPHCSSVTHSLPLFLFKQMITFNRLPLYRYFHTECVAQGTSPKHFQIQQ